VDNSGVSLVVMGSLKDLSRIKIRTIDPVVVCVLGVPGDSPPE
jgi:hypothetical protein